MKRLADERGMTLVELVVTSALLMVLLIPMLRFFDGAVGGAAELEASTQRYGNGRATFDQLARELRQAYTGDPALAPVAVPDPQRLVFHSPTTESPFRLRRITYELAGSDLVRRVAWSSDTSAEARPWDLAADGPAAPVMRATTVAFTPITASGTIRAIDVRVTSPNGDGRAERTFETTVTLRNLR